MKVLHLQEKIWQVSKATNQEKFERSREVQNRWTIDIKEYNPIVGFIGYQKNSNQLSFKTKNLLSKRDTGAPAKGGP